MGAARTDRGGRCAIRGGIRHVAHDTARRATLVAWVVRLIIEPALTWSCLFGAGPLLTAGPAFQSKTCSRLFGPVICLPESRQKVGQSVDFLGPSCRYGA